MALIKNNAKVAAQIAAELANTNAGKRSQSAEKQSPRNATTDNTPVSK